MSKAKRKGKIFIDYLRNGYGATSVVPYSVRTKNGGAVALPIDWSEIDEIDPAGFNMKRALERLKSRKSGARGDPWKDYFSVRQSLPNFGGGKAPRTKKLVPYKRKKAEATVVASA
jgi:bifunctional non-homologous end joining protein LigD